MSVSPLYDVIVVGAGVEGLATAENLAKRPHTKILLLEQYPLPHSRGSSHGQSRVTRRAYTDAFYTQMMDFCTSYWADMNKTSGQDIYKKVGYLAVGDIDGEFMKVNVHCMDVNNAPYTLLSPEEFRNSYPMLQYGENIGGLLDPDGGVLRSDKALLEMQKSFQMSGGTLRDGERVESIVPGEIICVHSNKGSYRSKAIVLCCGPWTNKLLTSLNLCLPLKPIRISVCYWKERIATSHSPSKLPTLFDEKCCGGYSIYGLPSLEYPGYVKLCLHHGPEIDPDQRDIPDTSALQTLLQHYVTRHFPGLEPRPSIVETCIYTMTPDCNFILDHHPDWKNIIIGAGFSGHGFKLSPAVGQILADLALTGKSTKFDAAPFSLARFECIKSKL